ncbi:ABC transporter ATP-binding protein [Arthrobacter methylotrophus]|uniref:ABC transporter ATP-binding protein n=1 Tax=Arthrobacter methylotrophus TaxID=121291 RepID=A0ABV5UPN5_9MICC
MIKIEGLSKSYGNQPVVNDVTFTVHPGMVTGLLGPNGAGKSTIMKMILGLVTPTSGKAWVNGASFASTSAPLGEVGALLDAGWVHPARSARNHIRAIALTQGIKAARVDEVLELTGLATAANMPVRKYSLGMKQRLGLAGALLGDPRVLILDEPINGLDLDGINWIRSFLRQLADEGRTVLVSSHLMSEMERTADRIIVMGKGQVLADGAIADIVGGQHEATVLVSSPQPDALTVQLRDAGARIQQTDNGRLQVLGLERATVGDIAASAGIALHELRSIDRSLEDAYEQLVAEEATFSAINPTKGHR